MREFIQELQRREVFRTAGLYVGVCWILVEAASVLLPAFNVADWVLRGLIYIAVVGFPIILILAWFYDVTEQGIELDDARDSDAVPGFGERKTDFIIIGLLAIALTLSLYLNISSERGSANDFEPVAVLIADFDNRSGGYVHDGLLEIALGLGIENAPFVWVYDRQYATKLASTLHPGTRGLPTAAAQIIAAREHVDVMLSGSIEERDGGFLIGVAGIVPETGKRVFRESAQAEDKSNILNAVDAVSRAVRQRLGDKSAEAGRASSTGILGTTLIEAANAYAESLPFILRGDRERAIQNLISAIDVDPDFGLALASLAILEFDAGRHDEAGSLWERALPYLDDAPERTRLRVLGEHASVAGHDYEKALGHYSELLGKFPADVAIHNAISSAAFNALDFRTAYLESKQVLDVYPDSQSRRRKLARSAMYAGEFEVAATESAKLIESGPLESDVYLRLALSNLARGHLEEARQDYLRMESALGIGSLAKLGLADISIYAGQLNDARILLQDGIERDIEDGDSIAAALKYLALADAHTQGGDSELATEAANNALGLAETVSARIAAAIIFADSGDAASVAGISDKLSQSQSSHERAYGMLLEAMLLRHESEFVGAIDTLRSAIKTANLWRIRLELGRVYLEAGMYAEAFSEFKQCWNRRGEAAALFLDDMPTFRHLAELNYWIALAQEGLGMQAAAAQNLRTFIALRPEGGPLALDARQRLQAEEH